MQCVRLVPGAEMAANAVCFKWGVEMVGYMNEYVWYYV